MPIRPPTGASAERRGFALGITLIALTVIGAIIATAFFTSTQEFRVGRNSLVEQRAMTAAEYGSAWGYRFLVQNKSLNLTMANGATRGPDTVQTADSSFAVVRTTRLNQNTYWVVSEGFSGGNSVQSQAVRRVNNIFRVDVASFNVRGAVTVRGGMSVQGSALVNGNDSIPASWKGQGVCPPTGPNLPGIAAPDTNVVCDGNCSSSPKGRIIGNPAKAPDVVAADTNTYFRYGNVTWNQLVAAADVKLTGGIYKPAPSTSNGACNALDPLNWGDPKLTTACRDYFPIIYVNGDLKLASNAYGQGILLVNGSITLVGGFEFNGIVVARNDFNSAGNGNKITGTVFAANSTVSDNTGMNGNSTVQYSSCAVQRAANGAASVARAKERGWAELFQ
jgi:hypothetical protein